MDGELEGGELEGEMEGEVEGGEGGGDGAGERGVDGRGVGGGGDGGGVGGERWSDGSLTRDSLDWGRVGNGDLSNTSRDSNPVTRE